MRSSREVKSLVEVKKESLYGKVTLTVRYGECWRSFTEKVKSLEWRRKESPYGTVST